MTSPVFYGMPVTDLVCSCPLLLGNSIWDWISVPSRPRPLGARSQNCLANALSLVDLLGTAAR